jgi:hypothetical protein
MLFIIKRRSEDGAALSSRTLSVVPNTGANTDILRKFLLVAIFKPLYPNYHYKTAISGN